MKRLPLLLVTLSLLVSAHAQRAGEKIFTGELLLQLAKPGTLPSVMETLRTVNGKATGIEPVRELSDELHIWHIRYNPEAVADAEMLLAVKRSPYVLRAQFNHEVTLRNTEPDDPGYGQQWQYDNDGSNGGVADADIDAPEAWDITTGGLTAQGDSIVVAIIDDGVNLNHPDLAGNLWKNYAETPGNGIDDDGNGYIDDFDGWNAQNNNGTITGGSHGTCVTGIIGARGNNNLGVAGVNWNVKLMIIRGSGGGEASVVSAYGYALKARKLYNQTNGTQGAFVVATNSSFGIDNGNPADYPLWCAMYDSLGVAGILSVGATANANINVDVGGDIPTACPSDYLLSVTNVKRNDVKETSAGYGVTTIDIGSFGSETWTLTQTGYGAFGGTSGATPHVTGTAALMYSVPCPDFIQFAKTDPEAAALQIKEWILQSGDPNASLDGITVTGKRLNAYNAVSEVLNNCGPCPLPGGVSATSLTVNGATVSWNTVGVATRYILEYREQGAPAWQDTVVNAPPFTLGGLQACTQYQYRLRSICNADSSNGYTNTFTFKTDGCCEPPLSTGVSGLTATGAQVSWPPITAATAYNFRYRKEGAPAWTDLNNLGSPSQTLSSLEACTRYEYQIATVCTSGTTPYGSLHSFKTKGCGACEEATYCQTDAFTDYLYIDEVELGSIQNHSGDNGGYASFIEEDYAWLTIGEGSTITLTPAFPVFPVTANWGVWVDWNQNGAFEGNELAVNTSGGGTVTGTITPPFTADTGITRMRVATVGLQDPSECGDNGFGEVEDYCVRIKPSPFASIAPDEAPAHFSLFPNPATDVLHLTWSGDTFTKVELTDISGKVLHSFRPAPGTELMDISTDGLSRGIYLVRLTGITHTLTRKVVIRK